MPMLRFRESKHGEVFCGNLGFSALVPIRLYPCFVFPPFELVLDYRRAFPFCAEPAACALEF